MKNSKIQNPLTVIAIFAGLAETAGTAVLIGLPLEIQKIFVWFVMLLPVLLISLFFLVLAYRHEVLYAPGDFSNEQNFANIINAKNSALSDVVQIVEETKTIAESFPSNKPDEQHLQELKNKINEIESKLEDAKKINSELANDMFPYSKISPTNSILNVLKRAGPVGLSSSGISLRSGIYHESTRRVLFGLKEQGLVLQDDITGDYFLTEYAKNRRSAV
ncbi:hypothetical protein [Paenibacillus sp. USDA918EY]|uniref:hypothetical protein n=1 Tax=Paenibacillus sp. USDA918EY TaxID=2689575 RepID=UPI001359D94E|nr:hypothetical protein [Paenibacillus sp. USDA918EY]